jgi:hypothetical protein
MTAVAEISLLPIGFVVPFRLGSLLSVLMGRPALSAGSARV